MTPEQFLAARFNALMNRDYQAVYQSYHDTSPFRQHFASAEDYIHFAEQHLGQLKLKDWQIVDQRHVERNQIECLLVMVMQLENSTRFFYESALLILVDDQWHYHSAQKLGPDDYPGPPERISFTHFDQVAEKIRF